MTVRMQLACSYQVPWEPARLLWSTLSFMNCPLWPHSNGSKRKPAGGQKTQGLRCGQGSSERVEPLNGTFTWLLQFAPVLIVASFSILLFNELDHITHGTQSLTSIFTLTAPNWGCACCSTTHQYCQFTYFMLSSSSSLNASLPSSNVHPLLLLPPHPYPKAIVKPYKSPQPGAASSPCPTQHFSHLETSGSWDSLYQWPRSCDLWETICYDLVILSSYGLLFHFNAMRMLPPSLFFVIAHSAIHASLISWLVV